MSPLSREIHGDQEFHEAETCFMGCLEALAYESNLINKTYFKHLLNWLHRGALTGLGLEHAATCRTIRLREGMAVTVALVLKGYLHPFEDDFLEVCSSCDGDALYTSATRLDKVLGLPPDGTLYHLALAIIEVTETYTHAMLGGDIWVGDITSEFPMKHILRAHAEAREHLASYLQTENGEEMPALPLDKRKFSEMTHPTLDEYICGRAECATLEEFVEKYTKDPFEEMKRTAPVFSEQTYGKLNLDWRKFPGKQAFLNI